MPIPVGTAGTPRPTPRSRTGPRSLGRRQTSLSYRQNKPPEVAPVIWTGPTSSKSYQKNESPRSGSHNLNILRERTPRIDLRNLNTSGPAELMKEKTYFVIWIDLFFIYERHQKTFTFVFCIHADYFFRLISKQLLVSDILNDDDERNNYW